MLERAEALDVMDVEDWDSVLFAGELGRNSMGMTVVVDSWVLECVVAAVVDCEWFDAEGAPAAL